MAASQGRVFVLHFYSRTRRLLHLHHHHHLPFENENANATTSSIRTMMMTTSSIISNNHHANEKNANATSPSSVPPPPNPIPNRPLRGPPSHSSSFTRQPQAQASPRNDDQNKKSPPLPLQSSVLHFLNNSLTPDHHDTPHTTVHPLNNSPFPPPSLSHENPPISPPTQPPLNPNQNQNQNQNQNPNPNPNPNENADFIFKKMKETGLIPNAVAMLDGLCKDGLVHEAMKLFGLMREKGTIPDVVIYTAVVEGFCKAHKPDDAKRIFNKMLTNGITPNAFTYSVFIQGLCYCNNLEDALHISSHMLQAGHSPNVPTFVLLLDALTRDKGVEQARAAIENLKQTGLCLDEKAVRDYLDKKAPSMPLVWEALFGNKTSHSHQSHNS